MEDWLFLSCFDFGDLFTKVRCDKNRCLIWTNMIKSTDHDELHTVGAVVNISEHILTGFRGGINVPRSWRNLFINRGFVRKNIAIFLSGPDQKYSWGIIIQCANRIENVQCAFNIDIHGNLRIIPGKSNRTLGCKVEDIIWF